MESCPTQTVLPLVGLAADKVIRDRYMYVREMITQSFVGGVPSRDGSRNGSALRQRETVSNIVISDFEFVRDLVLGISRLRRLHSDTTRRSEAEPR
ncbi:MAG: hypothetical protein R6U98_28305 [Pirellulaceae bacterium]